MGGASDAIDERRMPVGERGASDPAPGSAPPAGSAGCGAPFGEQAVELEAVKDRLHLPEPDGRRVALQVPGHSRRRRAGMVEERQQHLDDGLGREVRARPGLAGGGAAGLPGPQLAGARRPGEEIDEGAAQPLAAGAPVAHGGQQEGMHRDLQQGAEFLVGEAGLGLGEQAPDGGGEGGVAGEVDIADREQAEAVEAGRVAVGVEAAVVVVAAQVADLAEVAEGGAAGDAAEGLADLVHGDGGFGGQQRDEPSGGTGGHDVIV